MASPSLIIFLFDFFLFFRNYINKNLNIKIEDITDEKEIEQKYKEEIYLFDNIDPNDIK